MAGKAKAKAARELPVGPMIIGATALTGPAAFVADRMGAFAAAAADPLSAALDAPFEVWGEIARAPFSFSTEPVAIICAMAGACVPWAAVLAALVMSDSQTRKGEEHGSARWATAKELEPYWKLDNPDPERNKLILSERCAIALSRTKYHMDYDRNLNVLVIGGSGSGKTRYYVKPNVGQMNSDYFITDPKGDLIGDVGQMLVDRGYEISSFNTSIPERSLTYNPLEYVRTDLDIQSFAKMFISMTTGTKQTASDPFWEKAETLLYVALIAFMRNYLPRKDYHMGSLLTLMTLARAREGDENYKSPLDLIFEEIRTGRRNVRRKTRRQARAEAAGVEESVYTGSSQEVWESVDSSFVRAYDGRRPAARRPDGTQGLKPSEDYALENYLKFKEAAGKTLKSIIISCNVRLAPFTAREVRGIVCGTDQMHLDRFGDPEHPRALFAVFKDTDQKTLGFLHGMLVYQCIRSLCDKADRSGGRLPRFVNFLLDEYKSLRLPADISDLISVIRSRNIGMSIILQNFSQLNEMYEKDAAESIRGCCDTVLYLGSGREETAKFISDSVGQQTVFDVNYSSSHGGQGSWSKSGSKVARPLIDPAEVGKLPKSQCIVLIGGENAIVDDKYPLEQHPNYKLMDVERKFDVVAYMAARQAAAEPSRPRTRPRSRRTREPG